MDAVMSNAYNAFIRERIRRKILRDGSKYRNTHVYSRSHDRTEKYGKSETKEMRSQKSSRKRG